MTPLVLYHANCYDGACAAWAALTKPSLLAEAHPVRYGEAPPLDDARGRDVYVVDFSYPAGQLEELARVAHRLCVIDHHRTGRPRLLGLVAALGGPTPGLRLHGPDASAFDVAVGRVRVIFHPERSGAGLAWDFFGFNRPRPWFVDYVEDRDLWRWELPNSTAVNAWIASFAPVPEVFARFFADYVDGDYPPPEVIAEGRAILRYRDRLVERLTERPDTAVIGGVAVPVINTPILASEACNQFAAGHPFAAAWSESRGVRTYQLRAAESGGVDVSEIAACYGGGGHRHAAGFKVAAPDGGLDA